MGIPTRCAVVCDGVVRNIIMAVPSDPAETGCMLVEIMNGVMADIGWLYADGVFTDPNPPAPEEPS